MSAYSWLETLEIEKAAVPIMDAIFGADYIVVKATRAHQRQKIDCFHIHRRDGRLVYRVDYKVDDKAGTTYNLALEETSVKRNGRIIEKGWIHTTIADRIVSYVPATDTAYVMAVSQLRESWTAIQSTFRLRQTETRRGPGYFTEFYAVPIRWLKQNRLIESELSALGVQLRLPLKRACAIEATV